MIKIKHLPRVLRGFELLERSKEMGHYDSSRPGYCPGCGAAPGNMTNGKCMFCNAKPNPRAEQSEFKKALMATGRVTNFDTKGRRRKDGAPDADRVRSVEMKYVRHSTVGFVLWPLHLGEGNMFHNTVGRALRYQPEQSGQGDFVVSAGFYSVSGGKVRCYGESESLGIRSKAGDSAALAAQLGLLPDALGA